MVAAMVEGSGADCGAACDSWYFVSVGRGLGFVSVFGASSHPLLDSSKWMVGTGTGSAVNSVVGGGSRLWIRDPRSTPRDVVVVDVESPARESGTLDTASWNPGAVLSTCGLYFGVPDDLVDVARVVGGLGGVVGGVVATTTVLLSTVTVDVIS